MSLNAHNIQEKNQLKMLQIVQQVNAIELCDNNHVHLWNLCNVTDAKRKNASKKEERKDVKCISKRKVFGVD